jgi:hypothetical protein
MPYVDSVCRVVVLPISYAELSSCRASTPSVDAESSGPSTDPGSRRSRPVPSVALSSCRCRVSSCRCRCHVSSCRVPMPSRRSPPLTREAGYPAPFQVSSCRVVELSSCRVVELSSCRVVELSSCRVVECPCRVSNCRVPMPYVGFRVSMPMSMPIRRGPPLAREAEYPAPFQDTDVELSVPGCRCQCRVVGAGLSMSIPCIDAESSGPSTDPGSRISCPVPSVDADVELSVPGCRCRCRVVGAGLSMSMAYVDADVELSVPGCQCRCCISMSSRRCWVDSESSVPGCRY